jgi:hypothetical protein
MEIGGPLGRKQNSPAPSKTLKKKSLVTFHVSLFIDAEKCQKVRWKI